MVTAIQASEPLNQKSTSAKIMDSVGQSSIMHAYSKYVQSNINDIIDNHIMHWGKEPASLHYQKLWEEAQSTVGIHHTRHLPAKKFYLDDTDAMTTANGLHVNEDSLNQQPLGAQRSMLFHEAIHTKNHDDATRGLLRQIGFWGGSIGTYATLKKFGFQFGRKCASVTIGLVLASYFSSSHSQFTERRADTQGHLATKCSTCVQESIEGHKNTCQQFLDKLPSQKIIDKLPTHAQSSITELKNDLNKGLGCDYGYLNFAELEKIAQDLGNKKCAYHQQQDKNSSTTKL